MKSLSWTNHLGNIIINQSSIPTEMINNQLKSHDWLITNNNQINKNLWWLLLHHQPSRQLRTGSSHWVVATCRHCPVHLRRIGPGRCLLQIGANNHWYKLSLLQISRVYHWYIVGMSNGISWVYHISLVFLIIVGKSGRSLWEIMCLHMWWITMDHSSLMHQ